MHDYYPTALRDSGLSSLVSLNYSVSSAGVPVGIVVTKADHGAFARPAVRFLSDWRFKVPPNWTADGGPTRRFKMRVKFLVTRVAPAEKWDPNDPLFTITEHTR
ncbi:MAG TPA: energy transducer TonB [Steroidobacteraceae bacterium]|nr:energy transducer TonB [Steroidobacteraceae bacterium]